MLAKTDHEDKRPASQRVADDLMQRIEAGEFQPGGSLPTYRQLANEYSVAVNTALAAVRLLREKGAVTLWPNVGAKVRERFAADDAASELRATQSQVIELQMRAQQLASELSMLGERLSVLAAQFDTQEGDSAKVREEKRLSEDVPEEGR